MLSSKKHGLGRGISSLIGDYQTDNAPIADISAFEVKKLEESGSKILEIDIKNIKPNPNQPRKTFDPDALAELKDSIIAQGVLQPILVEEIADSVYVIVAGERRYRAAKMAGLKTIPAIVRSFSDLQRMEVALIENIQRENLNPVEEAKAYSYLLSQAGISQDELAKKVGKSRPAISNSVRILKLPEEMLKALEKGLLSAGHARSLAGIENPADQITLFKKIVDEKLSVRETEDWVTFYNNGGRAVNTNPVKKKSDMDYERPAKPQIIMDYEERFRDIGIDVDIKGKCKEGKKGFSIKGKIVIPFSSEEQINSILESIYRSSFPEDFGEEEIFI